MNILLYEIIMTSLYINTNNQVNSLLDGTFTKNNTMGGSMMKKINIKNENYQ